MQTGAAPCTGSAVTPERLFLQQLGSDRVIIKWRGNRDGGEEATTVCFGLNMDMLTEDNLINATVTETGHSEALLQGLTPDSTYYYSIGGASSSDARHSFRTAPETGSVTRLSRRPPPAYSGARTWGEPIPG